MQPRPGLLGPPGDRIAGVVERRVGHRRRPRERRGRREDGDVEQLGRRVTTAVVQSLFSIIILDALFALMFLELDV